MSKSKQLHQLIEEQMAETRKAASQPPPTAEIERARASARARADDHAASLGPYRTAPREPQTVRELLAEARHVNDPSAYPRRFPGMPPPAYFPSYSPGDLLILEALALLEERIDALERRIPSVDSAHEDPAGQ